MPEPRTQFRVGKTLYVPIEGLRKEYERHRFLHHQDARRVKTEVIIRTLAEHAGLLGKPTDPADLARHQQIMALIRMQRDLIDPSDRSDTRDSAGKSLADG